MNATFNISSVCSELPWFHSIYSTRVKCPSLLHSAHLIIYVSHCIKSGFKIRIRVIAQLVPRRDRAVLILHSITAEDFKLLCAFPRLKLLMHHSWLMIFTSHSAYVIPVSVSLLPTDKSQVTGDNHNRCSCITVFQTCFILSLVSYSCRWKAVSLTLRQGIFLHRARSKIKLREPSLWLQHTLRHINSFVYGCTKWSVACVWFETS